jgi:hypothetical protein
MQCMALRLPGLRVRRRDRAVAHVPRELPEARVPRNFTLGSGCVSHRHIVSSVVPNTCLPSIAA